MSTPRTLLFAMAAVLAAHVSPALAASECASSPYHQAHSALSFRVDNDLFGGEDQDQGYTNGALLSVTSPNLVAFADDACMSRPAKWLHQQIERHHPGVYDQQNMVFTVGQGLFTPEDAERSDLIRDDRPYAAILMASWGYIARNDRSLVTTQVQLGVIGPWALGEESQEAVHHVIDSEKFNGWDHQLRNEPLLGVIHERMQRWRSEGARNGGWGWDAVSHWGGSLGNRATYANAGAELRFGWHLPDDFGSTPVRPTGENTLSDQDHRQGWSWHLFATTDARWVLRDITLDGNTFRNSHSVDRRPLVADLGYGIAVTRGRWKFSLARYHRTREFDQQRELPVYGSFTISKMF